MKKLTTILFAIVATMTLCFAQSVTVVIAPFEAVGAVSKDDAEAITELFTSRMVMQGKFNVVEHRKLEQAKAELKFQAKEWASDDNKVVAVGKAVNAQYVVRGQLLKLGNQYFLSTTLLKLEGFEVLSASQEKLDKLEDAMSVLPKLASTLAEKIVPTPKAPSSPIIGVWTSEFPYGGYLSFSATIEFLENGTVAVHNWGYIKNQKDWYGNQQSANTGGSGNYSINGSYLELYLQFYDNEMRPVRYSGTVNFAVGNTEFNLDKTQALSWGAHCSYHAREVIGGAKEGYVTFHKIR